VFVTYGLCIGWPASRPPQKPRLPEDMVIHYEQYNTASAADLIQTHNTEMAAHYRELGRETPAEAWSQPIADRVSNPVRPHLRAALEALGFRFD
jgi:FMN reductase (NADPH)